MTNPVLLLLFAQGSPAPACDTARIRQVILELQARQESVGVQGRSSTSGSILLRGAGGVTRSWS